MTNTSTWGNIVRGVAFGDAWGDPNEFKSIAMLIKDSNGLGTDIPDKMRITDDTQMTLYLAKALDESWDQPEEVVKAAIREQFLIYNDDPENYRAPGTTVTGSLGRLKYMNWKRATSNHSDGSGTVMRTSPCAFLPEDRWVGVTAYAAAITHGTANAIAAAILNVALLRDIMTEGGPRSGGLLEAALFLARNAEAMGLLDTGTWLEDYNVDLKTGFRALASLINQALEYLPELQDAPWRGVYSSDPSMVLNEGPLRGGGWRAHYTLVIALLAIDMFPGQPWEALRRAVNTDGDSDTIGAVAGGLIGALEPTTFYEAWAEIGTRFERIYREWIEDEADNYKMAQVAA